MAAAYLLVGVGIEIFNVSWFTATQREVPPVRSSRVSSLDFVVSYGLPPLGLAGIVLAIAHFWLSPVLGFAVGRACSDRSWRPACPPAVTSPGTLSRAEPVEFSG